MVGFVINVQADPSPAPSSTPDSTPAPTWYPISSPSPCSACNSCNTQCNDGEYDVYGNCSASAPANPAGYGNECGCTGCEPPNSCSTGTIDCYGSCVGSSCQVPVDPCVMSDWSACSAACGGGTQTSTCSGSCTYLCDGNPTSQSCNTQPCFNYALSNSANISVQAGNSGSNTITKTLTAGSTQAVTLTVSGLPAGASLSPAITNNPSNPTSASTLTIATLVSTPAGTYSITVTGSPLNKTTTFNLVVAIPTFALTVARTGTGTGTVNSSPAGIACGATCSAPFNLNTSVTLTAVADTYSAFTGWSGSGCSGTGTCAVTMTQAKSVTANFDIVSPPGTPTVIASTPACDITGGGKINLSFGQGAGGFITDYFLFRSPANTSLTGGNGILVQQTTSLANLVSPNSGLAVGASYQYQLLARGPGGDQSSAITSATTANLSSPANNTSLSFCVGSKCSGDNYGATTYPSTGINRFSTCKKVKNTSANSYFIPTGTANEWSSFYNYPPAGITTSICCP